MVFFCFFLCFIVGLESGLNGLQWVFGRCFGVFESGFWWFDNGLWYFWVCSVVFDSFWCFREEWRVFRRGRDFENQMHPKGACKLRKNH